MSAPKHTYQVIRPLPGTDWKTGDLVDASGWRNVEKLVRNRYLKPLDDDVEALKARIAELEAELLQLRSGKAAAGRR